MVLLLLPFGRGPGSAKPTVDAAFGEVLEVVVPAGVALVPEAVGEVEVLVEELGSLNDCALTLPVPLVVCACSAAVHNSAAALKVTENKRLLMTGTHPPEMRFLFSPTCPTHSALSVEERWFRTQPYNETS
jgi:hypothetical protein